ncbi:MAG: hypothetical protein LUQ47_01645 [Methanotrichaceae archaeon]|nr:hypothetical protein [Methanotrichaceae archaeon]
MKSSQVFAGFMLLIFISNDGLAGNYLYVKDITMYLNEADATFHLNYTLDTFTKIYVLALGSRHIQPDLASMFGNFNDIRIEGVDYKSATILAAKAGKYNGSHYLFDSRPLEIGENILQNRIERFRVIYPDELNQTFYNISCTPEVFYMPGKSTPLSNQLI